MKIWTWPADDADSLVTLCRHVLAAALSEGPPCAGHGRTIGTIADLCAACTRAYYTELLIDYKCADLRIAP